MVPDRVMNNWQQMNLIFIFILRPTRQHENGFPHLEIILEGAQISRVFVSAAVFHAFFKVGDLLIDARLELFVFMIQIADRPASFGPTGLLTMNVAKFLAHDFVRFLLVFFDVSTRRAADLESPTALHDITD